MIWALVVYKELFPLFQMIKGLYHIVCQTLAALLYIYIHVLHLLLCIFSLLSMKEASFFMSHKQKEEQSTITFLSLEMQIGIKCYKLSI